MVLECRGEWEAAAGVYDAILAKQPSAEGAHKRKIALLRSRGQLEGAAGALVTFLETWQSDLEAWAELGEVYTLLGLHRQAAFCIEELLAAAPGASAWHTWYAAVQCTVGDAEALRLAQKHYAAAIELSEGRDVRALYGAVAVAAQLGGGEGGELGSLAASRLRQLYAARAQAKAGLLEKALA